MSRSARVPHSPSPSHIWLKPTRSHLERLAITARPYVLLGGHCVGLMGSRQPALHARVPGGQYSSPLPKSMLGVEADGVENMQAKRKIMAADGRSDMDGWQKSLAAAHEQ